MSCLPQGFFTLQRFTPSPVTSPLLAVNCVFRAAQVPRRASHPQCSFHSRGAVLGRLLFFMQPTLLGFCVLYVAECVTALYYVKYFVLQGVSPAACICRLFTGFSLLDVPQPSNCPALMHRMVIGLPRPRGPHIRGSVLCKRRVAAARKPIPS